MEKIIRQFFVYATPRLVVAPAATVSHTIAIQSDAAFIWDAGVFQADVAAAAYNDSTRPVPIVTVLITDGGSGRQFSNNAVPMDSIFGVSGSELFKFPEPRRFAPNSSITISVTSLEAVNTYNLTLSFIGRKEYKV